MQKQNENQHAQTVPWSKICRLCLTCMIPLGLEQCIGQW